MGGWRIATVFGGSGFVGRQLVSRLAQDGYAVRVGCRRTDLANAMRQLGDVGQVTPFFAPVEREGDVRAAIRGASVVVNLAAVLGGRGLKSVNVEGAERVARIAAEENAEVLVQMSALGASDSAASLYGRSRAAGEASVARHFPTATIVRASVIFGVEDHFLNMLGGLARYVPFVMPVYGAGTKLQPVHVGDVAEAIRRIVAASVAMRPDQGSLCELGGPDVLTMREIAERVLAMTGRRKPVFVVPSGLAALQAAVLERLPGQFLTRDQLKMLSQDNVVSGQAPGFRELGMAPVSLDLVAPAYMARYAPGGGRDSVVDQVVA
ncbi:NADH-ubiquinone oxidoreductase 39 kDa subunit [Acetobacter estunensis NRIC 0472]|uniref:Sugar nucleotide-binding protein n=1 Tax=Acetobacter estunensis TaxID=104097 RepID=A0A967B9C7_9PROT|nr:complex I NDUFA9 subunit family protein [Acetobacter estunensis]NHO52848.1 sugar nucleotide-binding protein [Acetobacter estunensis]GBQ28397.1 NADH-ubiquinone oxidoreductase 39 kDa subunit [Acetobacter estunensis NRIC 0472]